MTSGCYDRRDVCGYYRLRPAPAGIPGRDVRGILEAGRRLRLCGQQKMPICRSLMERTGIEPVTSGLQILCGDSPSVPIGLGSSLMAGSRRLGLAGGCRRLAARAFHERSRMTSWEVLLPRAPQCRAGLLSASRVRHPSVRTPAGPRLRSRSRPAQDPDAKSGANACGTAQEPRHRCGEDGRGSRTLAVTARRWSVRARQADRAPTARTSSRTPPRPPRRPPRRGGGGWERLHVGETDPLHHGPPNAANLKAAPSGAAGDR
jgi:hypothetical protein